MEINNLKDMVVLKNLPSNLIEEAFVILKPNQKKKVLEAINKKTEEKKGVVGNSSDYIIKEAECVVTNYIRTLEKSKTPKMTNIEKKYRKLKWISFGLGLLSVISIVFHVI